MECPRQYPAFLRILPFVLSGLPVPVVRGQGIIRGMPSTIPSFLRVVSFVPSGLPVPVIRGLGLIMECHRQYPAFLRILPFVPSGPPVPVIGDRARSWNALGNTRLFYDITLRSIGATCSRNPGGALDKNRFFTQTLSLSFAAASSLSPNTPTPGDQQRIPAAVGSLCFRVPIS